jgi:hypothetical protein
MAWADFPYCASQVIPQSFPKLVTAKAKAIRQEAKR